MTKEEKRLAIQSKCNEWSNCNLCPLNNKPICYSEPISDEEVDTNYEILFGKESTDTPNDIINHPSHYCRDGGMESIDEMVLVFGRTAVMHFCLCNVWKYRYRSATKNGEEDLKKSDWYMRKYKELCDE